MDQYHHRIRDTIHGFIHLSDKEVAIVDHPIFQRLRNIKQLALTHYIYPGATHTRFEHSLGVLEFVTRAFDSLLSKRRVKLGKEFRATGHTIDEAKQVLRLTALLHDIGHLPFSHAGEAVLPDDKSHEHVTIALIENSELSDTIRKQYSTDVIKLAISLLSEEKAVLPEFLILRRLIKGAFDFDRTDYLLRDSHHCGVYYGNFDFRRLLETLDIAETEEGLDLAIQSGGVHCLEALLVARYFMFAQVYFHRTRRIYDYYLAKYLEQFFKDKNVVQDLTQIAQFDDVVLTEDIRHNALTELDPEKHRWASHIYYRPNHHSLIWETSDHASYDDVQHARKIEGKLEGKFNGLEIYGDYKAKGFIHQIFLDQRDDRSFDIKVIKRDKTSDWIRHQSGLLKSIRQDFRVIRVYGYGDRETLKKAKTYAKRIRKD